MTTDALLSIPSNLGLLLAAVFVTSACEQPPPPSSVDDAVGDDEFGTSDESGGENEGEGESDEDTGELDDGTTSAETGEFDETLYPLVEGARWTYVVTNTHGQVIGHKFLEVHATTWEGMQAWELVQEPDLQGNWDASIIVRDGDLALRVHREEFGKFGTTGIFDYEPGFARASDAWTRAGFQQELAYDRIAYDSQGTNPEVEARAHTYEVLSVDEPITVAAGTFNCVKVERIRTLGAEAGAVVWYWFAPGVGKVREERPLEMEIEELFSVQIPGGATYP